MGKSQCSPPELWNKVMPLAAENHTSFEKQLLMYYGVLAEAERLTMGTK